jgi:DNA-binding NarL/FixJ family response regulator
MHNNPAYAQKVLKLGAKGYLTKNSSSEEIFKAIEEVMKGKLYICTEIKDSFFVQNLNEDVAPVDIKSLSLREIEVVKLLIKGYSSKDIGLNLHISRRTVESHRYNILKKLKLKNTASLITFINSKDISF